MSTRQPGDALPRELVRDLRLKSQLSQDELAHRLGVKGGKSVISAWENGRAPCEGPAAELLLNMLAGTGSNLSMARLVEEAERTWRRAPTYRDGWRQCSAIPETSTQIELAKFAKLFPGVEIPPDQHAHGFPTIDHGLPPNVYGIGPGGWYGAIPIERERAPQWIWALKRNAEFFYREAPWEEQSGSVTMGHIHVGSLLQITLSTIFFLGRLAKKCSFPASMTYSIQLDMEGVGGRGMVGYRRIPISSNARGFFPIDEPQGLSSENHLCVLTQTNVGELQTEPLTVGYRLVGELALLLRPDFADPSALEDQLRRRRRQDDDGSKIRFLGFLDSLLK